MSQQSIVCRSCGSRNEVAALACRACGLSLVDGSSSGWVAPSDRFAPDREPKTPTSWRPATVAGYLVIFCILALVGVGAYFGLLWVNENVYLTDEPTFDNRSVADWVELLDSDDRFMRRRAAKVLDGLSDRFKRPTAEAVIPALEAAAEDEDETVQKYAKSALGKLAARFPDLAAARHGFDPCGRVEPLAAVTLGSRV